MGWLFNRNKPKTKASLLDKLATMKIIKTFDKNCCDDELKYFYNRYCELLRKRHIPYGNKENKN